MIYTGKLNRHIIFQRLEVKEDDMGQDKSEWKNYKTVWGTVKPYKSSEYNFMGKLKPEVIVHVSNQHEDCDRNILMLIQLLLCKSCVSLAVFYSCGFHGQDFSVVSLFHLFRIFPDVLPYICSGHFTNLHILTSFAPAQFTQMP